MQSFDTSLRRRVGRIDAREEVLRRLELLKSYDVTVIVDLIYGLPGQTKELWLEDIKTLLATDVDGMDLYQLNIFPGGDLDKALQSGESQPVRILPVRLTFTWPHATYCSVRALNA